MTLGEKIRQLRREKGFSQEELAAHLNVSRQAVSKWEKSLSYPDTENLLALAGLFGVSSDELAGIRREEATPDIPDTPHTDQKDTPKARIAAGVLAALVLFAAVLWRALPDSAQKDSPGTSEQADDPTPRPPVEVTGEFALLWETGAGWEHLAIGRQDAFFPFGTTLSPTEMEQVSDTDFSTLKLHTVTCGALKLDYLHISDAGAPEAESVDRIAAIASGYETPRGVGVGSDEADVLSRYGDDLIYALKESGAEILCRHDYRYIYAAEATGGNAVIFYISGGHVAGILVQAGDDMGYDAFRVDHISRFPVKNGQPDFSQRKDPEQETINETRAVYIALYALQNDVNLSAEDVYRHRQTIYNNLQFLDWQVYGLLGEAGKELQTLQELLTWLQKQETLSEGEITGLLAGSCRTNLDGWMTDSYTVAMARAFTAYPESYVKCLSASAFSDDERELIVGLTAYGCAWPEDFHREALAAAESVVGDPLRYTAEGLAWGEALLSRIRDGLA